MVIRIMNVPDGLQPASEQIHYIKFVRMCGDIAMYEYVGSETKIFDSSSNPTNQGTTNGE